MYGIFFYMHVDWTVFDMCKFVFDKLCMSGIEFWIFYVWYHLIGEFELG